MKMTLVWAALVATALVGCGSVVSPATQSTPEDDKWDVRAKADLPGGAAGTRKPPESMPKPPVAAGHKRWDGKDCEGTTFKFMRAGESVWFLKQESTRQSFIGTYTEATITPRYVQLDGAGENARRFRLYGDKLLSSTNDKDWEEIAKGGWVD